MSLRKALPFSSIIFKRHLTLPSNATYSDLPSYFDYARNKALRTHSTVFNGTTFELLSKRVLQNCLNTADLYHVGGANDNGIDIHGTWDLKAFQSSGNTPSTTIIDNQEIIPILNQTLPKAQLIVQCKNYSRKITPKEIRELSGILFATTDQGNRDRAMILFCAPSSLTKKGLEQLNLSNVPIGFFQISNLKRISEGDVYDLDNYSGGQLRAFYANPRLEALLDGTDFLLKMSILVNESNQSII